MERRAPRRPGVPSARADLQRSATAHLRLTVGAMSGCPYPGTGSGTVTASFGSGFAVQVLTASLAAISD